MVASLPAVRAALIAALVALVLYSSGLLVVAAPLPFLYVSMSRGRTAGFAAAALALAAVVGLYMVTAAPGGTPAWAAKAIAFVPLPGQGMAAFFPAPFLTLAGIGYFGFFVAVAVALSEGARRRWDMARWGAAALAAGVGVIALVAIAAWAMSGSAVIDGAQAYAQSVVEQVVSLHQGTGAANDQVALLADHAEEVARLITQLAPSLIFIGALFAVAVNLIIGRRIIRAHHSFAHVHNLARFRLPDILIWAVIAAGLAFFADRYIVRAGWLATVGLNGLISLGAVYFLQGMAVVVYFLQGIRIPLIRMLAYVAMVVFLQTVSVMLVAVGVADVWANFRLRRWRALHHQE